MNIVNNTKKLNIIITQYAESIKKRLFDNFIFFVIRFSYPCTTKFAPVLPHDCDIFLTPPFSVDSPMMYNPRMRALWTLYFLLSHKKITISTLKTIIASMFRTSHHTVPGPLRRLPRLNHIQYVPQRLPFAGMSNERCNISGMVKTAII